MVLSTLDLMSKLKRYVANMEAQFNKLIQVSLSHCSETMIYVYQATGVICSDFV